MKHVYYVPDCPECGTEMVKHASYDGEWADWWACPKCRHESRRVCRDDFDALTDELVAPLKEMGE